MDTTQEIQRSPAHNTGFVSGGVMLRQAQYITYKLGALCFYSSSVLVDSEVYAELAETCSENLLERKAPKMLYTMYPPQKKLQKIKIHLMICENLFSFKQIFLYVIKTFNIFVCEINLTKSTVIHPK